MINRGLGPVSRKSRRGRRAVRKTPTHLVCKAVFFSYVGIKFKITAKFSALRRFPSKDTKIIKSEMRPKSFGTFDKRAPGLKRFGSVGFTH